MEEAADLEHQYGQDEGEDGIETDREQGPSP